MATKSVPVDLQELIAKKMEGKTQLPVGTLFEKLKHDGIIFDNEEFARAVIGFCFSRADIAFPALKKGNVSLVGKGLAWSVFLEIQTINKVKE